MTKVEKDLKESKDLKEWQKYLQLQNQLQHAVSQMIANNNRHFRKWDYERRQEIKDIDLVNVYDRRER